MYVIPFIIFMFCIVGFVHLSLLTQIIIVSIWCSIGIFGTLYSEYRKFKTLSPTDVFFTIILGGVLGIVALLGSLSDTEID